MSSPEEVAYPILRKHDVDYVLVIFGGLLGFSGDDINKFLWMIRISVRLSLPLPVPFRACAARSH